MTKQKKERLDVILVTRGLAETRQKAQALILAGSVLTGDRLLDKPGAKLPEDVDLRLRGKLDLYVSRGAHKLIGALDAFNISLKDRECFDVGASTGGFTQVCLERGAKRVVAVDVGHNQMHWKMRSDPRVVCFEGVNMKEPHPDKFSSPFHFACVDASFISLKRLLGPISQHLFPGADVVALIKPQHEVGKEYVGKGGIVTDAEQHRRVTSEISDFAETIGFQVRGLIKSPITGSTGNIEFLIHLIWKTSA